MFGIVLKMFYRQKRSVLFVLCTIVGLVLSTAMPLLNGVFIDFLISNREIGRAVSFALLIGGIGVAGSVVTYVTGILSIKLIAATQCGILQHFVEKVEQIKYSIAEKLDGAYVTQQMTADVSSIVQFVVSSHLSVPFSVIVSIYIVALFASINAVLAFAAACSIVLYCFFLWRLSPVVLNAAKTMKQADSSLFSSLFTELSSIFPIHLHAGYPESADRLKRATASYIVEISHYGKIVSFFNSAQGFFLVVFQVVLLVVSSSEIIYEHMTIGQFVMVSAYFAQLLNGVKALSNTYKSYQEASASFQRMVEYDRYELRRNGSTHLPGVDEIEFLDLSYETEDFNPRRILEELTYRFDDKKTYLIVGRNGSGKTTLLKLITGLYDSGGAILLNGLSLAEIDLDSLKRETLGVVPQHLDAPDCTVACELSNLTRMSEFEIRAKLHDDESLPFSTDVCSLLTHSCDSLSGGELRKVYLWAAIQSKPSLLLLDEPTTGLDAGSKRALMDYLADPGRIAIVTTHDNDLINTVKTHILLD